MLRAGSSFLITLLDSMAVSWIFFLFFVLIFFASFNYERGTKLNCRWPSFLPLFCAFSSDPSSSIARKAIDYRYRLGSHTHTPSGPLEGEKHFLNSWKSPRNFYDFSVCLHGNLMNNCAMWKIFFSSSIRAVTRRIKKAKRVETLDSLLIVERERTNRRRSNTFGVDNNETQTVSRPAREASMSICPIQLSALQTQHS